MTRYERVLRWELDAPDEETLLRGVEELCARAVAGDADAIRRSLASLIPEYRSEPSGVAADAEDAEAPDPDVVELPLPPPAPRHGA
jgi:hypothetical protein